MHELTPPPAAPPARKAPVAEGVLELHPNGFGFLRKLELGGAISPDDTYVSPDLIRRFSLREGSLVTGELADNGPSRGPRPMDRRPNYNQRDRSDRSDRPQGPRLVSVTAVEGIDSAEYRPIADFDRMTPIDPKVRIKLETRRDQLTTRVMDLFTPVGKGTRGLIVAPPRTGKTFLIQHVAEAVAINHPECTLMVLLIDERPEEVTDMSRTIKGGKVYASSNDRDTYSHARLAQLVIARGKRLAEQGKDVVILLDSITRLARAFNKNVGSTGRTMTGGLDVRALDQPKRLFGQARAFDEGGSLTILGTALIETGSKMDDIIFQEFKGTGNMELVLDQKLSDRRTYPAIDLSQSGTRKEERLLEAEDLKRITLLRRSMTRLSYVDGMEQLLRQMEKYENNAEFLNQLDRFMRTT
ncbi:transcription termination factor Rho [bacterium]|nr:transcription termination factor Rho [bacterium]